MQELWKGRPLSELSRDELIEVVETLAAELRRIQSEHVIPLQDDRLFILARIAELS